MQCLDKDGFMQKLDQINVLVGDIAFHVGTNIKKPVSGIHTILLALTVEIKQTGLESGWDATLDSISRASVKFNELNNKLSGQECLVVPVIEEFKRQTNIDKSNMLAIIGEPNRIAALATILKNVGVYLQTLDGFGFLSLILGDTASISMRTLIITLTSLECPSVTTGTKMTEEWAAINKIIDLLQSKFDR